MSILLSMFTKTEEGREHERIQSAGKRVLIDPFLHRRGHFYWRRVYLSDSGRSLNSTHEIDIALIAMSIVISP